MILGLIVFSESDTEAPNSNLHWEIDTDLPIIGRRGQNCPPNRPTIGGRVAHAPSKRERGAGASLGVQCCI